MVKVLQGKQNIGELFGQGLGQGLSTGLQQLASERIRNMNKNINQQRAAKSFEDAGIPNDLATVLSFQSPSVQGIFLKNYFERLNNTAPESDIFTNQAPQEADMLQRLSSSENDQFNQQPNNLANLYNQNSQPPSFNNEREVQPIVPERTERKPQLSPQKPSPKGSEVLKQPTAKQRAEEQKLSHKQQMEIDKETKPVYDEIKKDYKASQESKKRLSRMEKLNNEGNLGFPLLNSIVKAASHGIFGHGFDINYLMTADAQEFDKLSKDFIKDAKSIFGARITDQDLRAFMDRIPTLSQSKEGRRRIINNFKNFNEASEIRENASEKIIEANHGRRPRNYDSLVEKVAKPELDALANKFESGLESEDTTILKRLGQGLGLTY
jgi:hypothetical protein